MVPGCTEEGLLPQLGYQGRLPRRRGIWTETSEWNWSNQMHLCPDKTIWRRARDKSQNLGKQPHLTYPPIPALGDSVGLSLSLIFPECEEGRAHHSKGLLPVGNGGGRCTGALLCGQGCDLKFIFLPFPQVSEVILFEFFAS
uniref:Uncharacterized protein n=1 Tax=Myotis myotis TaxID=51298 RepID=A0A7J7SC20_MYOMY|nr:hypothetical protein mMyoMyo1_009460 [Myotis myotis]